MFSALKEQRAPFLLIGCSSKFVLIDDRLSEAVWLVNGIDYTSLLCSDSGLLSESRDLKLRFGLRPFFLAAFALRSLLTLPPLRPMLLRYSFTVSIPHNEPKQIGLSMVPVSIGKKYGRSVNKLLTELGGLA